MTQGPRRPRTFQCRDQNWEAFETAAHDLGVSVDELIEDAMLAYAKARGKNPVEGPGRRSSLPPPPGRGGALPAPPSRARGGPSSRGGLPAPLPPPKRSGGLAAPPGRPAAPASMAPPPARRPHAAPAPPPPPKPARIARLFLGYQGQSREVDKDLFVLGRSKQSADFRLADPNVSREHAVIERAGDAWVVVDRGSTNGVYVNGERVTRQALANGDVITITTHEIFCSLR